MSEFNQTSFLGGMNLLSDDTRLQPSQYRIGLNVRNRYDVLDEVHSSVLDTALDLYETGILHELITFGNYLIAFKNGNAYYRLYNDSGWRKILGFGMSKVAPRYWTCVVPLGTTNYVRVAPAASTTSTQSNAFASIQQLLTNNAGTVAGGSSPGLLVQDNVNQPMFIYADQNGIQVRTTKTYDEWGFDYDMADGTMTRDDREYVPIGNLMAYADGVLFVVSPDKSTIFRAVSGRPLDFVINVRSDGDKGGNAWTTSYSVGTGNISALKGMPDGSLFVSAGNANFVLVKNTANNAPLMFGEFLFIRKYVCESTIISDRCIIDSAGDTRFIDLNGVRSFNAIQQFLNEGRNSPFTAAIQLALKDIVQDVAAAILFDNYELYGINTIFGPAIAVYDTISNCWTSFDVSQTGGKKIKQFAKIELGVQRLYAVTEDDELYALYASPNYDIGNVMTSAISASMVQGADTIKLNNAKNEVKPVDFRLILNRIRQDSVVTLLPIVDNRVSSNIPNGITKYITYVNPTNPYSGLIALPDIDTQLTNLYFPMPNCEQGWKASMLIAWTGGGSITQFSMSMKDETPLNPLKTQATTR